MSRPFDLDHRPFETKALEAAALDDVVLDPAEVSALKQRISMVLFDRDPGELTVAAIQGWIKRALPGIRQVTASLATHGAVPGQATADSMFGPRLLRRLAEGGDIHSQSPAHNEVLVSLVNGRPVRLNLTNSVVMPLPKKKD